MTKRVLSIFAYRSFRNNIIMKPKRVGKRFVWNLTSTELFLELWQGYIEELRGTRVNAQIYKEIADKLHKFGPTHVEVKAKVDNMTRKYRIELNKSHATGLPSKWEHFKTVQELLNESRSVKMNLVMANSLDFSPFEDSDSNDFDNISSPNRNNSPAIEQRSSPEIYQKLEPPSTEKSPASQRSDYSTNTYPPAESMDLDSKPDRLLAIEEASLAIQREKLKAMKSIADELSSIHRDFLNVYTKHK